MIPDTTVFVSTLISKYANLGFFDYQTYIISTDEDPLACPWASLGANASAGFLKLSGSAGSAAIKMSPLQFQVPTKIFLKGVKVAAMCCSRCVYLCRPLR